MTLSLSEHTDLSPYTLHEDQARAVEFIKENKAVLLKAPTGAGKTIVAVESARQAGTAVVLVVAPINTESGWRHTVERQYEGAANFSWINSKVSGKVAFQKINDKVPGWYFVGREYFRRLGWKKVKPDFIIVDECHSFTNKDSVNHRILKTAKAPYQLMMSATPAGNHMQGIWALARWLWPQRTERGFLNWVTTYFHTEKNIHGASEFNPDGKLVATTEREPGKLWGELPAAIKMKSVYKGKPTIHEIEVDISPTQRKHYKELEEEAITWLGDNPLAVDIPAVLHMRLRQVCLAVPSVRQDWVKRKDKETGLWVDVWGDVVWFEDNAKSTKIDAVVELIRDLWAEKPFPILIFTDSRIFATIMTKQLQGKGINARQFVGGMSKQEREWKKDNFGVLFDVMVCTIPAIGEGTDGLQHKSNVEVWMNFSYNQLLNIQTEGRLSRQGQTEDVQRYVIKAKDTVEVRQIGKLKSDQQLLNAGYQEAEDEL